MKQAKQIMRTFIMTGVVLFVVSGFISPEVMAFAEEEERYVEITGTATVEFVAEDEADARYVEVTGSAEVEFATGEEEARYVEITGTATVEFVAEEEMMGDCGTDGVELGDITHIGAEEVWDGERISLDEYSLEGAYLVVRGEVSPVPGCEIERVSVSTDDGISWEDADVAGDGGWEYRFAPAEDTTYNITASAVAYRAVK